MRKEISKMMKKCRMTHLSNNSSKFSPLNKNEKKKKKKREFAENLIKLSRVSTMTFSNFRLKVTGHHAEQTNMILYRLKLRLPLLERNHNQLTQDSQFSCQAREVVLL